MPHSFRSACRLLSVAALLATGAFTGAEAARADGYVYVANSYYVAPPVVYGGYPIYSPAPVVVYQPTVVAPAPVAGYYAPLPGPVGRVREHGYSTPHRARYRYSYEAPNGVEYKYRYKRDGGYVRVREKWDD